MSWHNKLTVSGIVTVACGHCYRLPDSDLYRACKIARFLLKLAVRTIRRHRYNSHHGAHSTQNHLCPSTGQGFRVSVRTTSSRKRWPFYNWKSNIHRHTMNMRIPIRVMLYRISMNQPNTLRACLISRFRNHNVCIIPLHKYISTCTYSNWLSFPNI